MHILRWHLSTFCWEERSTLIYDEFFLMAFTKEPVIAGVTNRKENEVMIVKSSFVVSHYVVRYKSKT